MADEMMALLSGGGDDLYNSIIKENLEKRILVFNEYVSDAVLENYILYIIKWNREDEGKPIDLRQKIKIYVNSKGGDTFSGFNFCDVIKQSETPIVGICFSIAASMGYHIFLACHDRIAFNNSVFLQHDGDVEIQNSTSKAKDTMKFIDNMEERTKQHVLDNTTFTSEEYDKMYDQEFYMYANEAKTHGVVDKIVGEDCTLDCVF